MLRIVSYYTPTHEEMCRRYVMSQAHQFDEQRFSRCGQTCPTGEFYSPGWNDCMLDKLRCLSDLPTDGMTTLYVDADVALMPGLHDWVATYANELSSEEVAFADDVVQWCAGIMLFRSTTQVREFWRTVSAMSQVWNLPDQDVIAHMRLQCNERKGKFPIRARVLPTDRFCNWATVNGRPVPPWNGEPFLVPKTCLAWHANWTVGIENKLHMLERVAMAFEKSAADNL